MEEKEGMEIIYQRDYIMALETQLELKRTFTATLRTKTNAIIEDSRTSLEGDSVDMIAFDTLTLEKGTKVTVINSAFNVWTCKTEEGTLVSIHKNRLF